MKKTNPNIQQKTEELLLYLGKVIQDVINEFFPTAGFAFFLFKFHEEGRTNYISNAERESMIKALKEIVKGLEKDQDFPVNSRTLH
jgi:hypothetical protein